jgi:hypothetical protein
MDWVSKVQNKDIRLILATDATGRKAYYFLRLVPLKRPIFDKVMKEGKGLNLEEFGEVLMSGYGEYPPEFVLTMMKQKYNYEAPPRQTDDDES